MNRIIFVSAIIGLSLFSCKKEQITPEASQKTAKSSGSDTKSLHCTPWRTAADPDAAAIDLNAVGVCNTSTCSSGTPTYFYINNKIVKDSSGSTWYFLPLSTVSIADQNAIWSDAVNQAIASTPTGYSLSSIHNFRTEAVGGPLLMYLMRFDVTYIRCTGGGGGGEN